MLLNIGEVPDFTCFNLELYANDDTPILHFIGGYKSGRDTGAEVSFERVLDTGSGSNLPTEGSARGHSSVSARLYDVPDTLGAKRFGAYNCIFSSQETVKITTILLRGNGKERKERVL